MSDFYAKYVIVAGIGATLVWQGVPKLRQALTPVEESIVAVPRPVPGSPVVLTPVGAVPRPVSGRDPSETQPATAALRDREDPASIQSPASGTPPSAAALTTAATSASSPEESPPPPTGPVHDWGVLAETATWYTAQGTAAGRLTGGTVVERLSSHESSLGAMARCRVLHNQVWRDNVFILEPSLVMFQGAFTSTPVSTRDRIVRYFTLRSLIGDRETETKERLLRSNPYFATYQAAAKTYTEFQARVKDLVAKRDAATGMERARLEDTLWKLKSEQTTLLANLSRAEEPYKRWRAANVDNRPAPPSDAQIKTWQDELAALEPEIRGMVKGL